MSAIPFAKSTLDREALRRRERGWLEAQRKDPAARYLPLWRGQPLLQREPEGLAWARRESLEALELPEPVLLGTREGLAHFAVDVSGVEEEAAERLGLAEVARFEDLRAAAPRLPADDLGIAAQARSLVDWHARHTHCAVCGGPTGSVLGGAHRVCSECQAEHFPRTDPVGIALVVRGSRCLLGRGPGWPEGFYSALAGFVEAGESLEDAVRREVLEEAGVRVGRVLYLFSQPWPFPSSLMMGCIAEALDDALRVDDAEIEEARWFEREELRSSMAGDGPMTPPPPMAIAHHLIRAWLDGAGEELSKEADSQESADAIRRTGFSPDDTADARRASSERGEAERSAGPRKA